MSGEYFDEEFGENDINDIPVYGLDNIPTIPMYRDENSKLLMRYLQEEGPGGHHCRVYDSFILNAEDMIKSRFIIAPNGRDVICFENLRILKPTIWVGDKVFPLTPKKARESHITYGCEWLVDIVLREGSFAGMELKRVCHVPIGNVPLMVGSSNCYLHGLNSYELAAMGEDPMDAKGYFIINGGEKVVMLQENLTVNKIFLMSLNEKEGMICSMTCATSRGTTMVRIFRTNVGNQSDDKTIELQFPSMGTEVNDTKLPNRKRSVNILRIFRFYGIGDLGLIKEGLRATNQLYDEDEDSEDYDNNRKKNLLLIQKECRRQLEDFIGRFLNEDYRQECLLKLTNNFVDLFAHSLENQLGENAEHIDRLFMLSKIDNIDSKTFKTTFQNSEARLLSILENDLFPHLNNLPAKDEEKVTDRIYRINNYKLHLLAIMLSRYLECLSGYRSLDDRDSWANKRVEGAGRSMEQLFRNCWRTVLSKIEDSQKSNNGSSFDLEAISVQIKYSVITGAFNNSFMTSNWGYGNKVKNNISQPLARENVVATYSHINTVDVQISRDSRVFTIRGLQNSAYGFICMVQTSEGKNCGLIKNLACTAKVTYNSSDNDIIDLLTEEDENGIIWVEIDYKRSLDQNFHTKVMCYGKFLGWSDGDKLKKYLLDLRRGGYIDSYTSIILQDDFLYIDIGPSRLIRPLLIVENNELVIDKKNMRHLSFTNLCNNGCVEYVSTWEQETIKLASSEKVLQDYVKKGIELRTKYEVAQENITKAENGDVVTVQNGDTFNTLSLVDCVDIFNEIERELNEYENIEPYTHCEIDPTALLGISAALIPWPDHSQAPRNTYQAGMARQALGLPHTNYINRMDGKLKVLCYPSQPLVATNMLDAIGLNVRGSGQNALVAFMSYPFTEEDSFVFNKWSGDFGLLRYKKYITYKSTIKDSNYKETFEKPPSSKIGDSYRYTYLNSNGLPSIGAPLKQGYCVIGKVVRKFKENTDTDKDVIDDSFYRDDSVTLGIGEEGNVVKVFKSRTKTSNTVAVKICSTRLLQEGDKEAPRNAQKGTIGKVEEYWKLPYDNKGIAPDFITNSSSLPSRMTLNYLQEQIACKHAAFRGERVNASAFYPFELQKYQETLKEYNYDENGMSIMYSGTRNLPLQRPINMNPVFMQDLKHHVKDKNQARKHGSVKPTTHQPVKGRKVNGGIRFGEMERDSAISYGASAFLKERLCDVSDKYLINLCKVCGQIATNKDTGIECPICQNGRTNIGQCIIPYAYKLLIHILASMSINLRPILMTRREYLQKMFNYRQKDIFEDDNDEEGARDADEENRGFMEDQEDLDETDINNYVGLEGDED